MTDLQSKSLIELNLDTREITITNNIKYIDIDKNIANIFLQIYRKDDTGLKAYLTKEELDSFTSKMYLIKPVTNDFTEITGINTEEFKSDNGGGVLRFIIPTKCTNRNGIVKCEMHINQNNELLASDRFIFDVKQSLVTQFNDSLLDDEDFPVLQQLIADVQEFKDDAKEMVETVVSEKIADGTMAHLTIADNSITTEKYKDGSITADKTNFIKSYWNRANLAGITGSKYWASSNGTVIEKNADNSNTGTLPVIQLIGGRTYQMNRINSGFCWVIDDVTGQRVKLTEHSGYSTFTRGNLKIVQLTVPNNSKLYITVSTNLYYADLMVVEGRLPYTYKKFNKPYNYEINDIPINGAYEETVKIGAGKDFSTLAEFVSGLSVDYPLDKLHQLTIVLDDGEHHLNTEFDIPQYVNMVSASNDPNKCKVLYTPTNVTAEQVSALSGIRMSKPNNKLKGIHFIGKNCRYTIHPESNGVFPNSFIQIDNCIFEHLVNDIGNWESQFAWGEGTSSGARLIANNCTFIAHADKSLAFSVHNNRNFENPILYTLTNCHFYSYGYGSCFRCEGMTSGTDDRVYLNNCELSKNVMLTNGLSIKLYAMGTTHVCSNSTNYFATNSQVIYNDFTQRIKNGTSVTIPAGRIVCFDNAPDKIRVMTDTDSPDILAGFTIGDTPAGELAFVVRDGWYRYLDDFTFGKKYGVVNGQLDANATNKIGYVCGGGFVRIKANN